MGRALPRPGPARLPREHPRGIPPPDRAPTPTATSRRKLKLVDVTTYTLARFVDWLADEEEQGKRLSDRTIANAVIPLRAALATAKREGLIRHNPAQGLALPPPRAARRTRRSRSSAASSSRPSWRWRPSATGCCSSSWRRPACGSARRSPSSACTSSSTEPSPRSASAAPSSAAGSSRRRRKHGRREVRLPRLAGGEAARPPRRPARSGLDGARSSPAKQAARSTPATSAAASSSRSSEEVDAPWAGFHTFRHTFASLHLSQGTNLLQLSRALGHHSPAFTLTRYTHLLPGGRGAGA